MAFPSSFVYYVHFMGIIDADGIGHPFPSRRNYLPFAKLLDDD